MKCSNKQLSHLLAIATFQMVCRIWKLSRSLVYPYKRVVRHCASNLFSSINNFTTAIRLYERKVKWKNVYLHLLPDRKTYKFLGEKNFRNLFKISNTRWCLGAKDFQKLLVTSFGELNVIFRSVPTCFTCVSTSLPLFLNNKLRLISS